MRVGIAGIDENQRIDYARAGLGIAGDIKGAPLAGVGIAGANRQKIVRGGELAAWGAVQDAKEHNASLRGVTRTSTRTGDRAAQTAWRRGCWFSDFTFVVKSRPSISWREGRQVVFGRENRTLPFLLDSCGFRREISRTAPAWGHEFDNYNHAIDITEPDGFASWDYPQDRALSMEYLRRMEVIYPNDERLWPVFSLRWTWDDNAYLPFSRLPVWAGTSLGSLIPVNKTQRNLRAEVREKIARQAIANAIQVAHDPDFRKMVERHGRVMIGGMVSGPCPRPARHVFFATLCKLYPEAQFWGLGQANFMVVNGLGMLGLLGQVWVDGSWWINRIKGA